MTASYAFIFCSFAFVVPIVRTSHHPPVVGRHNLQPDGKHATADTSDFYELVTGGGYVDKTGFLKDFLHRGDYISRIIRPKGWGKSTNLDMLRRFLDIEFDRNGKPLTKGINYELFTGAENVRLTDDGGKTIQLKPLEVFRCADTMKQFGTHPVVIVKLGNVVGDSYEEIVERQFSNVVSDLYAERLYLKDVTMSAEEKRQFDLYLTSNNSNDNNNNRKNNRKAKLNESLTLLRNLLHRHFNRSVVILIDDYDTPLNSLYANLVARNNNRSDISNDWNVFDEAYKSKDFGETFEFFKSLFENSVKKTTNDSVRFLLLTGLFHVQFSDTDKSSPLDDIVGYSTQDRDLSDYYGFDEREFDKLADRLPFRINRDGVQRWYGYNFGGKKLYRPWSIKHFLVNRAEYGSYRTAEDDYYSWSSRILALDSSLEPLLNLLEENEIGEWIDEYVRYDNMTDWRFGYLLFAGYLNPSSVGSGSMGLTVPNTEVKQHLEAILIATVQRKFRLTDEQSREIVECLAEFEVTKFKRELEALLLKSSSITLSANDYRSLMKCLTLYMQTDFIASHQLNADKPDVTLISKFATTGERKAIFIDYDVIERIPYSLEISMKDKLERLRRKVTNLRIKQFNDVKKILKVVLVIYESEIDVHYEIDYL